MEGGDQSTAVAYHEPSIADILIYSGFLLLLNLLGWVLDTWLFCGLVGQILMGVAWGAPGLQLLSIEAQDVVVQLGYLGLILLVYEGGLATSFQSLRANWSLSILVAATGIVAPIALSFSLYILAQASYLQCFAAGATLCSTSLGTTFAILRSSGLSSSRLGVVLSSAAMMDDIVGLVMVQIISNIGPSGASIPIPTVIRPVLVSLAFGIVTPVVCVFVIRPITAYVNSIRKRHLGGRMDKLVRHRQVSFGLQTVLLLSLVASSSYAGTSNLFAAYIAGAAVSWWDSEVPHLKMATPDPDPAEGRYVVDHSLVAAHEGPTAEPGIVLPHRSEPSITTASRGVYEFYFSQAVLQILQPFFFASIGFAIPITEMFSGAVLWRGVLFTVLMFLGKFLCGVWFLRLSRFRHRLRTALNHVMARMRSSSSPSRRSLGSRAAQRATTDKQQANTAMELPVPTGYLATGGRSPQETPSPESARRLSGAQHAVATSTDTSSSEKPVTAATIVGTAMVARGEIGFLISSIARSKGIFRESDSDASRLFLIVTWAILLCTIAGPLCLGVLVWRSRRLGYEKSI